MIMLAKPLGAFMFSGDFFVAWKYVPALMIAAVFMGVLSYLLLLLFHRKEIKELLLLLWSIVCKFLKKRTIL